MAQAKAAKKKRGRPPKKKTALQGGSKVAIERLQLVEQMMGAACTRREVVKAVMKKFGVTENTAYRYYDTIEREWQSEEKPRRAYQKTLAIKRLESAYKLAMATKKPSAAVRAVEAMARLMGLNEAEVVEVITPDTHPTELMTSAQLRSYLQDEMEKAQGLEAQASQAGAAVH